MGEIEKTMKRRSFIGSLLAIPAALMLPRIPKAAANPELDMIMESSTIITRNAEGFEIGEMVYWDSDEGCLKVCKPNYPPARYQRVMGIIVDSGSIDKNRFNAKITLGGM